MPNWEDRVDPEFDFITDSYSNSHEIDPYENDYYAHQIYKKKQPYDGILFSLSNVQTKLKIKYDDNNQPMIRNKGNIRDYLKIKKYSRLKVMGDCGAYSYVANHDPPNFYSVQNVARLYNEFKFDFGVSPDHIAAGFIRVKDGDKKKYIQLSTKERERRRKLTVKNSEEFINLVKEQHYTFKAIGAAQGYNPKSYIESVESLLSQGYEYIAIGGLVQYNNAELFKILNKVAPHIEGKKLHLFGVMRPEHIANFEKMGVTSFDSASYFRKAWLRSGQNYLSQEGVWYSAIRVPFSWNKNLIKNANYSNISLEDLEIMEANAYDSLLRYSDGKIGIDSVLSSVIEYDKLLMRNSENIDNIKIKYKKTLEHKPWENCRCEICQKNGIDIMIFRGTNRNKRRGYHNTWIFRNKIMNL